MALFGKKKKEPKLCPICGAELGKYNYACRDAEICDACSDKANELIPDKEWIYMYLDDLKAVFDGGEYKKPFDATQIPEVCPICGKELNDNIYQTARLKDSYICKDCEALLRGTYFQEKICIDTELASNRAKYADEIRAFERRKWESASAFDDDDTTFTHIEDELKDITLETAKEDIEISNAKREKAIAEYGGEYGMVAVVDEAFVADYKGGLTDDIGPILKKKLNGKQIVSLEVAKGTINLKKPIRLIKDGSEISLTVTKAVQADGEKFEPSVGYVIGKGEIECNHCG